MTITNYQTLQVAVANWLDNPKHSQRVPELISLFEGKVKRTLRVREMEKRATASTTASQANLAVPTDYIEMRNLKLNTDPVRTLAFLPPEPLHTWYASATAAVPKAYTVIGGEIIFGPKPDAVYTVEMDYYAFTVLSTSNATNWLITGYPDAYLFGSLAQTAGMGEPDPRLPIWDAKCEVALMEIQKADLGNRWNGPPLTARPDFVTP